MRVIVTGATGYIGSRFVAAARRRGWHVTAATRKPPGTPGVEWREYALEGDPGCAQWGDFDAIVHLAAITSGHGPDAEAVETLAAERLIACGKARGARVVFVSSQAARPDAPSPYGRIKAAIEARIIAAGGTAVRPGLVYGGPLEGLFGDLARRLGKTRLIPALLPAPRVQPVHVDDLAECLARVVELPALSGRTVCLADPVPVAFTSFLRQLASRRLDRRIVCLPFPAALAELAAGVLEPGSLERLRSLRALPVMDTKADLELLGVVLRPLASSLGANGCDRRRELVREARAMLGYVLRASAPGSLVRRYVRATESRSDGRALPLPSWIVRHGFAIGFLDCPTSRTMPESLRWRLQAATAIGEFSPAGASRMLGHEGDSPGMSLARIVRGVCVEAAWRVVRAPLGPVAARYWKRIR